MAASSIILDDAAQVPVSHTFVPLGPDKDGVFWWEDQSAVSPIGFWRISMQLKRPPPATAGQSSNQRTFRAITGFHAPVLETVSNNTVNGIAPAPTVSYTPRVFLEHIMPERSASLDRKNIRKIMTNLSANAMQVAMVETLIMPY